MYHERAPSIGWDSNHALGADRGPRQHCALGSEGGHLDHPNLGIHSKNHTTKRRDDGAAAGHRLLIDQHHQGVEDTNNSSNLADGLLEAGASLGGNDVAERLEKNKNDLICGGEVECQRAEHARCSAPETEEYELWNSGSRLGIRDSTVIEASGYDSPG
jgi:hypothetical protein